MVKRVRQHEQSGCSVTPHMEKIRAKEHTWKNKEISNPPIQPVTENEKDFLCTSGRKKDLGDVMYIRLLRPATAEARVQ